VVELDRRNILERHGPVLIESVQDPCGRNLHAPVVGMARKASVSAAPMALRAIDDRS